MLPRPIYVIFVLNEEAFQFPPYLAITFFFSEVRVEGRLLTSVHFAPDC